LGFSNSHNDADGIQRRLLLFLASNQGYLPSFILAGICGYLQVELSLIEIHYGKYIKLPDAFFNNIKKDFFIPIDNRGRLIINFTGPLQP